MYKEISHEFVEFAHTSKTAYHTVDNLKKRLLDEGYAELFEESEWRISRGGRYFTTRDMTSLIAFRIPESTDSLSFRATLTHSDSPAFKLKTNFASKTSPVKLDTEVYGGPILESFLDRPLSLSGRVTFLEDDRIVSRLVDIENACIIPRTPPHLLKEAKLNPAQDLTPVYSFGETSPIDRIAERAGVFSREILCTDIYAVPCEKGYVWGEKSELISSPRIDNLQSVFCALAGFLNSCDESAVPVMAVFDNEEVGSLSSKGADSDFLSNTLRRIGEKLGLGFEDYCRALSRSFFISADVAHALHPNHPELFDSQNSPKINGGIAVKFNSSAKYTSDSVSASLLFEIARLAQVPTQIYHNRSDIAGGSTLGRYSVSNVSVLSVDIGAPILAMHSALETAGCLDTEYLARLIEMFYSVCITKENNSFTVQ